MTAKKKPNPPGNNPTDKLLNRSVGGGFHYEWELGLEISLLALHESFKVDWSCHDTEVPIPRVLRNWLGDVESIAFDATSDKNQRLEDINIFGRTKRVLCIQVKSGKRTDLSDLAEIVDKFHQVDSSRKGPRPRYLLITEAGGSHDVHLAKDTLHDWFKETKAAQKAYNKIVVSCGKKTDSLLKRIWVVRGPLHQRVMEKNLHLIGRLHRFDCGRSLEREEAIRHRNCVGYLFKNRCVLKVDDLSPHEMKELIATPPTLKALAEKHGLDPTPLSGHPVNLLSQVLGWKVASVIGPALASVLPSLAGPKRSEPRFIKQLRDSATQVDFDPLSLSDLTPHQRNVLCLRRLVSIISAEMRSD